MSGVRTIIGPSSTKRRIATLIAIIGLLVVGNHLAGIWPRDVEIAYTIDPDVTGIAVDYLLEGDAVASGRFTQPDRKSADLRHTVRLRPGEYQARIIVYSSDGSGVEYQRRLQVPAAGLNRFDLKKATKRSQ
ncbi:MAG: hypothetical protein WBB42_09545 [Polyangiales bacterium]